MDKQLRGSLEDAVCEAVARGFGELGAQLRRDVRKELHRALKHEADSCAGPGDSAGGAPRGEFLCAPRTPAAERCPTPSDDARPEPASEYQPHEWTKHHFRRHRTKNFLQELADTDGQILHMRSQGAVIRAHSSTQLAFKDLLPWASKHSKHSTPVRHISARAEEAYTGDLDVRSAGDEAIPGGVSVVPGPSGYSLERAVTGAERFRESCHGAGLRNDLRTMDHRGEDGPPGLGSHLRRRGEALLRNRAFEHAVLLVIFANSAMIGTQVDYMATTMLEDPPATFRAADLFFCACFVLEVGLRLYVHRCRFFRMWGWGWNIMDLALVASSLAEEILMRVLPLVRSPFPGTVLRLVRFFRAVRIVRVLRVMRFAEDLRLLVACIVCSVKSFIWALLLLFLAIYMFGVYLTQSVYVHRLGLGAGGSLDEGTEELVRWYGSVPLAILSLFQALTGGVDWNDIVRPLMDNMDPYWCLLAALWIAFSTLAVLNIVTGTFVQSAIERSKAIKDMDKMTLAANIFSILDQDHNGTICRDEIVNHLDTEAVQEFFRTIDVDTTEAVCIFELLDCSGDGRIDFEELLSGVVRLQGGAKELDMVMLILDTKHGFEKQGAMLQAIRSEVQELRAADGGAGARRSGRLEPPEDPAMAGPCGQLPNT